MDRICVVIDLFETNLFDFIQTKDIQDKIEVKVEDVLDGVSQGLTELHHCQITLNNLKPSNILLSRGNRNAKVVVSNLGNSVKQPNQTGTPYDKERYDKVSRCLKRLMKSRAKMTSPCTSNSQNTSSMTDESRGPPSSSYQIQTDEGKDFADHFTWQRRTERMWRYEHIWSRHQSMPKEKSRTFGTSAASSTRRGQNLKASDFMLSSSCSRPTCSTLSGRRISRIAALLPNHAQQLEAQRHFDFESTSKATKGIPSSDMWLRYCYTEMCNYPFTWKEFVSRGYTLKPTYAAGFEKK
ncbi:hypothetical protein B9Z55_023687 [Caenorhabditis nigoni]|uniref:Protein kinase domain-containing protein n=1 Tax=Caenorhabditis nigoni TaxID=1611254 RepID=A0A2G5SR93_9PELO|nr:hypothetical protein B9Z55_023687 [Caenorhabditis nigoni]